MHQHLIAQQQEYDEQVMGGDADGQFLQPGQLHHQMDEYGDEDQMM